jgi:hypothetical protein
MPLAGSILIIDSCVIAKLRTFQVVFYDFSSDFKIYHKATYLHGAAADASDVTDTMVMLRVVHGL